MRLTLLLLYLFVSIELQAQDRSKFDLDKNIIFTVSGRKGNSLGTAFIVGKNKEHYFLATAKHVIEGQKDFHLTSMQGKNHPATLLIAHTVHDLALLQTPIFPFNLDQIPIVSNLTMNDEVVFISAKDSGKILPSKSSGIIRDVTGETISVIMSEVESGHSGSPIISSSGIAGIITKNGKYTECINIMLVNDLIDDWSSDLFENHLVLKMIEKPKILVPKEISNLSEGVLPINIIKTISRCYNNILNLIDKNINTSWNCPIKSGDSALISVEFTGKSLISKLKLYISKEELIEFPYGYIFIYDNEIESGVSLEKILRYKESEGNGYWYTYIFKKPVLGNSIMLKFQYLGENQSNITLQEIQLFGISL